VNGAGISGMQVSSDGDRRHLVALLDQVAKGDREAFQDIYRRTSAKLFGIALRILRDEALTRDVLQEAYVKIWQKAADFNPDYSSPITWMATIVRNRSLDEIRRIKPVSITALGPDDDDFDFAAELTHPLDGRERSEELRKLLDCLGTLDEERRQVVLLAYYRGLSRDELSRRFNRPVPTIKTWLHRSLSQLRGCLQS
jgi:RNA polymerase sigma-70 factor (ECF subfamily)